MEPREHDDAPPLDASLLADGDPVEHLWNAAHEMLRAFRTLIDAADEFVESQRGGRPGAGGDSAAREGRVHHIDIDVDDHRHGAGARPVPMNGDHTAGDTGTE